MFKTGEACLELIANEMINRSETVKSVFSGLITKTQINGRAFELLTPD
jgi:hypothetical protein